MIDFNRKLDEIRQQPEHIRIRYVWGALSVSMVIIFIVWIFSIKASFRSASLESQQNPVPGIKGQIEEQAKNLPSISDFSPVSDADNFGTEGVNPEENIESAPDIEPATLQENTGADQPTQ